ncbi:MAG: DUF4192 domain-containing protein [Candidatus Nanopelagicales bacterium]
MTALPDSPGAPRLVVRGPDCLPVVVPHLLGFRPASSVVVVGLDAASHTVRVTLRVDVPPPGDDGSGWTALAPALARAGAGHALLVVYPSADDDPWARSEPRPLPRRDVVDAARLALAEVDVRVLDALCVVGDRMASYDCSDPVCCPPEGRVVPAEDLLRVEAEMVGTGSAPLPSREALESVLDPRPYADPLVVAVHEELDALWADVPEYGPADVDSFLVGLAVHASRPQEPHLLPALVALAIAMCSWVRPRDLLMRALSVDADRDLVRTARGVLVEAVRCAPERDVAGVASMLAVCAWLTGDGAAARVALDRAESADPDYSLAVLLTEALDRGVPPWSWAQMMADLSIERILATGDGPPRRRSRDEVIDGLYALADDLDDAYDDDLDDGIYDGLDIDEYVCPDPGCAACRCAAGTEGL